MFPYSVLVLSGLSVCVKAGVPVGVWMATSWWPGTTTTNVELPVMPPTQVSNEDSVFFLSFGFRILGVYCPWLFSEIYRSVGMSDWTKNQYYFIVRTNAWEIDSINESHLTDDVSESGVGGIGCNATLIVLVPGHENVALHSPMTPPTRWKQHP